MKDSCYTKKCNPKVTAVVYILILLLQCCHSKKLLFVFFFFSLTLGLKCITKQNHLWSTSTELDSD